MTPYAHWTQDERQRMEAAMGLLAPGFRLYDHAYMKQAVWRAAKAYGIDIDQDPNRAATVIKMALVRDDFGRPVNHPDRERGVLWSHYGCPEAWWWLCLWRMLWWGRYDIDPWFEVKWWLWLELRAKRKTMTMWGCTNSGKSMWDANFAWEQALVWEGDCEGFVAGPWKGATDDKIWDAIKKAKWKLNEELLPYLGITEIEVTDTYLRAAGENGTAQIKFVAADKAASIQGKKSESKNGRRGILFVCCDEFAENPQLGLALREGIANNRGQKPYFGALGCNPKPGKIWHSQMRRFSEPVDMRPSEMRRSIHRRWNTRGGICVRFDSDNSPNQILGRDEFPYLFDSENAADLEHEDDSERSAQKFAWAFGDEGAESPTDHFRQSRAGVFDEWFWRDPGEKIGSLDPSFGGGDECIMTISQVGRFEAVHRDTGERRLVKGLTCLGQRPIDMLDKGDFIADEEFCALARKVARHRQNLEANRDPRLLQEPLEKFMVERIQVGAKIGGAVYVAVMAANLCIEEEIPWSNFVFDASQRADCADAIWKTFGRQNLRWYYEGTRKLTQEEEPDWVRWPYVYRHQGEERTLEKWSDVCTTVISMLWFFTCEILHSGRIVGGKVCQKGLDELASREIVFGRGNSKDVISKGKLKEAGQKSPAYAETLAMTVYFASRYLDAFDLGEPEETHDRTNSNLTPALPSGRGRFNIRGSVVKKGKLWLPG